MRGKWTEVYTKREDIRKQWEEKTEGHSHGEGWACTCGCNKRVNSRKHCEGPPREMCEDGFVPTSGGSSQLYRDHYREAFGHD